MPLQLPPAVRRSAGDVSFFIFLVTVCLCLLRARDLPSATVGVGGTSVSVGPADVALLVTAVLALLRLRDRRRLPSPALLAATAAFAGLIFLSSLWNGSTAIVASGKLSELAALTLGTAVFADTRDRLWTLILVVVGVAGVATAWGAIEFVGAGGGRQTSFLGEHDLAALATMALAVGLARLHTRGARPGLLAVAAIAIGLAGVVLGASLASLLGVYLATAAILGVAAARRELRLPATLLTLAVVGAATMGTLAMRQGELGFLQSWFGKPPETPGQYAASWSQRLIYAYVGGRVFLDRPLLGTGWHGELPPEEFAEYVPDARDRFPDQPAHYFPPTDRGFIPQQTYDQVLYELGLVGGAVFAAVVVLALLAARGYVPWAWLASLGGVLAGAALFGGGPLTAVFWLTLGVVAARPAGGEPE
jgi:O-antigen ligase